MLELGDQDGGDHVEFWWPAHLACTFELIAPTNRSVTGEMRSTDLTSPPPIPVVGGTLHAQIVPYNDRNGRPFGRLTVKLSPHDGQRLLDGTWKIKVRTDAGGPDDRVRGWIDSPERATRFDPAEPFGTVTVPGTAWLVVCVGAAETLPPDDLTVLELSSAGFESFAEQKPDVVAPGSNIRGALAGSTTAASPDGEVGTSLAAPHVTGVIALALSRAIRSGVDPWPSASEIIAALRFHPRKRSANFTHWHPRRGHGPVDAAAFFDVLDQFILGRDAQP